MFIQNLLVSLFLLLDALFPILFLHFLLLFSFGLIILREGNFALHLIIILEDIANEFTIGDIEITLLNA